MRIAVETEVESFLSEVFSILNKFPKGLYIPRRTNSEDKTLNFQIKTGLNHNLIREELLSLTISNYSYTDRDRDLKRKGELWLFGKLLNPPLIDEITEVYIKLKIQQGRVICLLSFHPSEYDVRYPYAGD
ncbi:MAG: hypothetical protein APF81_08145 [Desulfosporosinus sp. BRH_c37]|nr:MAG: hypothetical protein APF81_08145 [Desulfosporosinus sp. BRH_c37]